MMVEPVKSEPSTSTAALVALLERSARLVDADPAARPTRAFRQQARAQLWQQMAPPVKLRTSHSRRRQRLAAVVLATALGGAVAMPVLAGPGAVLDTVSTAAETVTHVVGFGPPPQWARTQPTATATLTSALSANEDALDEDVETEVPNHGATVSAVAKATPEPGENHGQQVREVARDNHGQSQKTAETTAETPTTETAKPENHGAAVSEAAKATPEPGENHGQQVREVARDNHGQEISQDARDNRGQGGQDDEAKEAETEATPEPAKSNPGRGRGQSSQTTAPEATATPTAEDGVEAEPTKPGGQPDAPGKPEHAGSNADDGDGKSDKADEKSGKSGGKGGGRGR